jgi:AcrR family transcriptional regulator
MWLIAKMSKIPAMSEPSGRRERKKDATGRAIAEAAMKLFLERSFDQVTIAAIAEAADVSVNTVFNYFPTKEDLFFSSYPDGQSKLVELAKARKPHESVIAFLKRVLHEEIERFTKTPISLAEIAYLSAMRRVVQESPALRVHAAQSTRQVTQDAEECLAQALAKDVQAEANDIEPRLIAGQVFAIYSTLFLEAQRRRRAGEKPEKIQVVLSAAAEMALRLLERGIGDFGTKPR